MRPSTKRALSIPTPRLMATITGSAAILLGLLVLLGWHTQNTALLQVRSTFAPMQYNEALGFLFCGIALLALARDQARLVMVCSLCVVLLGLGSASEYVLNRDLGIDQFFLQPFTTIRTSHTGRMAPNTALCFVLIGVALLRMRSPRLRLRLLPGLCNAAVLAFGAVACIGYLTDLQTFYGWKHYADMAVHAAVAFVVLSAGNIVYTWRQPHVGTISGAPRVPVIVGFCVISITLCLWQALSSHEHRLVKRSMTLAATSVRAKMLELIAARVLPLERMARRWELRGQPTRESWETDVALYVRYYPGLQAAAWVDATLHLRWLVPTEHQATVQGWDLGAETVPRQMLEAARGNGEVIALQSLHGPLPGSDFQIFVPILRDKDFQGFMVAFFRARPLLDQVMQSLGTDFALTVTTDDRSVYTFNQPDKQYGQLWEQSRVISFYGLTWRAYIRPTASLLAAELSAIPEVVLFIGLLTALMLAALTHLAYMARVRTTQVVVANQALLHEINEHRQTMAVLHEQLQQMEVVRAVSAEIPRELDLMTLLRLIIQRTSQLIQAAGSGAVYLWEPTEGVLRPQAWHNRDVWMQKDRVQLGEGLVGTVAQCREGMMVNDYQASPYAHAGFAEHMGSTAVIAEPLVYRDQLVGVITLDSRDSALPFTAEDCQILALFAAQAAVAIENAQLFTALQEQTETLKLANTALQREVAEREAAEKALQSSEARYRSVIEGSFQGILIHQNDIIQYVNPAGMEMFGYAQAQELLGRKVSTTLYTPEIRATMQAQTEAILRGERCPVQGDWRGIRKDGTSIWICSTASLTSWQEQPAVVSFYLDTTGRKEVETQLQQQQEALFQSEKLAAMGSLLASVAHELNNPLAVVMMQADLLSEEAEQPEAVEQALEIKKSAERCVYIVRNFLSLARQNAPQHTQVQLNTVITDAMKLLAYTLKVDDDEVELELAADLPLLWGDPHQLQQVVVNLVTNAHQALRQTPPPRRLTIHTRSDPTQTQVVLRVTDNGPGISSEVQKRIFEPFFTTKPPGVGTGLGLPFCQGIIETHGGTIGVESQVGQGTCFYVVLPVEADHTPESETLAPVALAEEPTKIATILIVDDEVGIARALAHLLRRDGHQVDITANGRQALSKLAAQSYDLILSDLRMPELDGPGLYRELAQSQPQLLRRFLFLSGDTLSPETQAFLDEVRVPRLIKPFTAAQARQTVQQALQMQ